MSFILTHTASSIFQWSDSVNKPGCGGGQRQPWRAPLAPDTLTSTLDATFMVIRQRELISCRKQLERPLLFVVHEELQSRARIVITSFLFSTISHWKKLKVRKRRKALQLRFMSIWHRHYRSVGGPLQRSYDSSSSSLNVPLLSSSAATPTWPHSSLHNMAHLDLSWAPLAHVVCSLSPTAVTVNV